MNINSAASSLFRPASAESFFGSTSANAIISAGQAASGTSDQQSAKAIISAQTREINRIRGYKLDLTPTDKQKLAELKEKILAIEVKAAAGTARADELDDRIEFLQKADLIIGKPIVDVEADDKLAEFNDLKLALLEPKLDNATAKRVAFMERFKDTIQQQINKDPERHSLQLKFQSIVRQLDALNPLRSPSQLSKAERKTYDDIVELINDHAGVKIELTAQESDKVAVLQSSIANFQGSLGPDPSTQPSAQAVANAYTALIR
jgi:hypothetical protein